MKKVLSALAAIVIAAASCTEEKDIRIEFEVSDPATETVVVVCRNVIYKVSLDSLGHAGCILEGMDAAYARVFYGTDMKGIYVEKGDRPVIRFDGNDFAGTFRFEGKKTPAVEYLNTVTLTALPDGDYALEFGEFYDRIRKKTDDALTLLRARDLDGTGNFPEMEEARIRYSYGLQLLMYPMAHVIMGADPEYRPDNEYYDIIRSYWTENPMYACIDEYREFMCEGAHVLDAENREENDLYPKLTAEMKYIVAKCSDDKVREALLHHIVVPYVDNFGTDGIQDMVNIYRTYVTDPVMTATFDSVCDKWDRKKPGKMSPDFSAQDIDGKFHSLAEFRGKYVYIDVWATWCRPCMMEVPYLMELEKKFEGREIVFVGLSVDDDMSKWEEKVRSGEMPGIQLYLGESDFSTVYGIRSIPRFILLDKEGRIINPEMTRPSSEDTEKFLSELEGI